MMAAATVMRTFGAQMRFGSLGRVEKKVVQMSQGVKERVKRLPEISLPRKRPGATGTSYKVEVLVPSEVKGVVVFVHGFAQYPDAYLDLLYGVADKAKVAIFAPETGIFALYVWKQLFSNLLDYVKEYGVSGALQYSLQSAVAEDSKELIDSVRGDEKLIVDSINAGLAQGQSCSPKTLPVVLLGHSMGGGLLFWVAANSDVDTFCSLAPFPKLQGEYDPMAIIDSPDKKTWMENILLVAGSLDFVARQGIFSKPGADIFNLVKATAEKNESNAIYSEIALGLHSNFEDAVYVGDTPLKKVLRGLSLLFTFFAIPLGNVIFIVNQILLLFQFVEGRSEQIEISVALASLWIQEGIKGSKPTLAELRDALDKADDVSEKRKETTKIEGPDGK